MPTCSASAGPVQAHRGAHRGAAVGEAPALTRPGAPALILASASRTRARMMENAGLAFEILPAAVDEAAVKRRLAAAGALPREVADTLAETKAAQVSQRIAANRPGALVLGADQVLEFDGAILDKPADRPAAADHLRLLSGRRHRLVSAAVLLKDGQRIWSCDARASLVVRPLTDRVIAAYLDSTGVAAAGLACRNVTLPHKEAAFALSDRADETARRLGAVNTLIFGPAGAIEGRNTDTFGFAENLKDGGLARAAGSAVVLGAGGAARAVVLALQSLGYGPIRVSNRTAERAEALVDALAGAPGSGVEAVAWAERAAALAGAALLVNATSLGMAGQPALDLPLDDLPDGAAVTDIVYTPLETPLLAAARGRGCRTVDGLGMLLHQGRPGFERW
ncbi:MAG: hypothetical protein F4178_14705, partial [Rhodospirillaceae bacterium]|nr:hypothetical protein [Rhodospirillaceae bacterium]